MRLDRADSAGEAAGGVTASGFRIHPAVASQVDQREKEVPQLPGKGSASAFRLANLFYLLPDLGGDAFFWIGPIETDSGGSFLQILGQKKRGKMNRDPVQGALAGRFFSFFQLMPPVEDLSGGSEPLLAKDVGVTVDQFFGQSLGDLAKIERPALFGQLGMENKVKEDVPQLLLQGVIVLLLDGLQQLVHLLQHHGSESLMGLFPVPGATLGAAQASHDLKQGTNFFHRMEIRKNRAFVESERDSRRKLSSLFVP